MVYHDVPSCGTCFLLGRKAEPKIFTQRRRQKYMALQPLCVHLLTYLGATEARQQQALRELHQACPDNFWMWCKSAAQYNVDQWGEYPLHRASRYAKSLSTVRLIFTLFPTAVTISSKYERNLPLHCALLAKNDAVAFFLLQRYPTATQNLNTEHGLPLHIAIHSFCPDRLVRKLLETDKMSIATPNLSKGQTPLHMIHKGCIFRQQYHKFSWWARRSEMSDTNPESSLPLLAQALLHGDLRGQVPLHVALDAETMPSFDQVQALLWFAPEAVRMRDHNGYLPLHIACQRRDAKRRLLQIVEALVSAFPDSLQIADQTDGFLPVHHALVNRAQDEVVFSLLEAHSPPMSGGGGGGGGVDDDKQGPIKLWKLAAQHHPSVSLLFSLLGDDPASLVDWAKEYYAKTNEWPV